MFLKYIFMFLKYIFVVLQPFLFLDVFPYFGHHCRPHLKFSAHVSPLIILTQQSFDKKNCALGVLRYGLGQKQPRLVILAT